MAQWVSTEISVRSPGLNPAERWQVFPRARKLILISPHHPGEKRYLPLLRGICRYRKSDFG